MLKKVIWSPLAEKDFAAILDYLFKEWDIKVANNFIDKTDKLITHISINPKQFQLLNKEIKIRKCVISKHNTIFYRESKNSIEIVRIFDTRQNPMKLKLE